MLIVLFFFIIGAFPFIGSEYSLSLLILALYYACLGQSWDLLKGYCGLLSLGHAFYGGLGIYISLGLVVKASLPIFLIVPLVFFCGAILLGSIVFISERLKLSDIHFTLLTLIVSQCALILFENWRFLGGNGGFFLSKGLLSIKKSFYFFLALSFLIFFVSWAILKKSSLGLLAFSTREDPKVAESVGVSLKIVRTFFGVLSGGFMALSGAFYGLYQGSVFPDQAFSNVQSLVCLAVAIIGGSGTLYGPILGGFFLAFIGEGVSYFSGILPGFHTFIYGFLLLIITLYAPQGIFPFILKIYNKFFRKLKQSE